MTDRTETAGKPASRAVTGSPRTRTIIVAAISLAAFVPLFFLTSEADAASRPKGAGELILDRSAVAAIIEAGIPAPIPFNVPPVGRVTVELKAPNSVRFIAGGLEADLGIVVPELGLRGSVDLRYVPEIDPEHGLVVLRPVRGKPGGMLAMLPDISSMLPPVTVPRGFDGVLHPKGGSRTIITVSVHEVEVTEQHLIVRLGLESRPNGG